ncbi:hypothetical protein, partial [Nocardia abscessus]|uniref:hypothetical protein n=1 Tax=Nocardia abscessus TaxID=120957 RepID=UPI003CC7CD17
MSSWVRRKFHGIGRIDRAIGGAVAELPASAVDHGLLRITSSANFSGLWLALAGLLATRQGAPPRRPVPRVVSHD